MLPYVSISIMLKNDGHLKREIGVWGLSANMINTIIGAGIFVLPAIVAAGLGSASIIAYLFCGLLITLVMLCFAEVGSKITGSGGVYTYIETSFGKYPGFLTAVLFLLAAITADAAVANALSDIMASVFPLFQRRIIKIIFFLLLFSGLAYLNVIGTKRGVGFVKIITIFKIVPLLFIVFVGFKDVSVSNLYWKSIPSITNIGEISLVLFFAFLGAESGLSVSGEVKNPKKTIPRAIRTAVVSVLIIYILIQTVSQGILGDSLATFKNNPMAEVANRIFGPIGFVLITIGAAVSMFGNLSSEILSLPRVVFAAARNKVIPLPVLTKIHRKYATPYISIIAYAGMGFLFASSGGFKQLAIISSSSALLIYLGVSLAAIKLRTKKDFVPDAGLFKIRGGYTVPILASLAILWFLSHLKSNEFLGMGIFILFLSLVYFGIYFYKTKIGVKSQGG